MPYGLPGALKLKNAAHCYLYENDSKILLKDGTLLEPRYQLADCDGFDGEWLCLDAIGKRLVVAPLESLKESV